MVFNPKDPSSVSLPLPTSRISRLFRPFLTKLASLDALFLTSSSSSLLPPPIATRTRTYSKHDAAKSGDYTGLAKGLPQFERGRKFKRATPRGMPKELTPIPPHATNKTRTKDKGGVANARLPQLPMVEMAEVSKRVHSCVQAFDNILDVVYPLSSAAATVAQIGVDPLGATSSRRVGESIEVWIELQLQEEFGYLANSEEEESSRVEGRRIELRDDWWESLPEQWRRFAVPVHALTIAIGLNIPIHGLYEALLEACIARAAVYEVSLLLPHMIHHAYTLPSVNAPGLSYLPTISRKVPAASLPLGSRWQASVSKAVLSVLTWLDHVSEEDLDQDAVENRWLGDAMDGLIRDGESRDAGGAILLLEVVKTVLDHPLRETVSELLVQRLSAWTQYSIFLSNTLRLRDPLSTAVSSIDASLRDLSDLLHERLVPNDLRPLATAVLALDVHAIWTSSLSETPVGQPPRIPCDSVEFCFLPHILSSHTSITTVLTLAMSLQLLDLPTIESGVLECAVEEYDRLSLFADSTILSPEEQQLAAVGLEELSDLATDAERRRLAAVGGGGGTPGGSGAKGMRWEEMVGAWVEATPEGRKPVARRPRQQLSPLTDEESETEEEESDQSDDPIDALDESSGEESEIVLSKEERATRRMGRMSLDGPSSIALKRDDEEEDKIAEDEGMEEEEPDLDAPSELALSDDELGLPSYSSSPPRPLPNRTPDSEPLPSPFLKSQSFRPTFTINQIPTRHRRPSSIVLSRPSRRTQTSLPDPSTTKLSPSSLSSKAPPPWLFSRFSPAAASPLRRLASSTLVPASPSPLLLSRLSNSHIPPKPFRKTSLQIPIVILSSSPSKFGSSPPAKKSRRTAAQEDEENEAPAPCSMPSSEPDDMDLFGASSPMVKTKPARFATRSGEGAGMREKLGRKGVVRFGLTREEV